ncbi:alpha/beta hydrolase family protein [Actomonas aquatica]|uniref:Alpha/beta fold hydrolase n=1 Tax=Actomonas aquatica TaxID=2866162 RepID=A0ABZ1C866_9BACT|nr:alpha/beta fold hydrolase [Opitutus sp. WL0086]WRQ87881.1 alpha/beta fold hydrolase [Opitutus sp. WL0086]
MLPLSPRHSTAATRLVDRRIHCVRAIIACLLLGFANSACVHAEQSLPDSGVDPAWSAHTAISPDDTRIPYLLQLQADRNGPAPVLVFFHAAPGGRGLEGLQSLAKPERWDPFLAAGWAVCVADYRGHTPNRPFEVLRGPVNATDDVAAVLTALSEREDLDGDRVAVMGNSLGGAITLQAVADGKITPRCLVLNAPASFRFIGLRGRPMRDQPLTDADIDRPAAMKRVAAITPPVLLIQGTADGLSPINEKLAELLRAAGQDVQLELYPDQGHSFTNGPDSPAFRDAVAQSLSFVQQHTTSP